jgi:glycosyltransferase involved in cell wall biosynthesis
MMLPQVSVILPYYEGLRWILKSIESVRMQREVAWELVVVDDGSKESPETLIESLADDRIRLIQIEHGGKGAALNMGIEAASADILCFLDQDDAMKPGRLKLQYDAFVKNKSIDVVYSDYERISEDGTLIDQFISHLATPQECLHNMAIGRGLLTMQTVMIRKQAINRIGKFSEDSYLTGLDDAEFFVRLFVSEPKLHYESGIVQRWVRHDDNYSISEHFHETRLVFLRHLNKHAEKNPMVKKDLPNFYFHSYYMRGLYFLENNKSRKAIPEFCKAIIARPFRLNAYYLLIKALVLQVRLPRICL